MKKLNKFFVLVLIVLLPTSIFLDGCTGCPEADEALPDLLTDALNMANSGDINAGDVINMAISISNILDALNECGTLQADESKYNFDLYYSDDNTKGIETWEKVGTATYQASSIFAGNSFNDNNDVSFNVPGFYYLKGISDSKTEVVERNEGNNDKDADFGDVPEKSTLSSNVLYVASTPEFEKKLKSGEKIEYITFYDKGNLVEFDTKTYVK